MKEKSKSIETLLEGIDKYYNTRIKLIKYLGIVLIGLTFIFIVFYNVQYMKLGNGDNWAYLIGSLVFLFLLIAMFAIAFISLQSNKNKRRKELRWFADTPDSLISYKIVLGAIIKITLISDYKKVTFPIGLAPLQVESLILNAFPYLKRDKEYQESENITDEKISQVDKTLLMENIPSALTKYFDGKFSTKLGCLPFIIGSLLIAVVMSLVTHFGLFTFWIFDTGNFYWAYLLLPLIVFGFSMFYSNSDEKKVSDLMKNPENIIWIYLERTKNNIPSADTVNLVVADVNKKHNIALFEAEEETLLWLSLYCPSAATGFYYEWNEIYEKSPNDFLNDIKN